MATKGKGSPLSPRELRILQYIASHGKAYFSQIRQALKLHQMQLSRALKKLMGKELISKIIEREQYPGKNAYIEVHYYYLTTKGKIEAWKHIIDEALR